MKRPRGSILIAVMFVLVVLSLLVSALSYRVALGQRTARQEAVMIRLEALGRSAVRVALADLDADDNGFDHPAEAWSDHEALGARLGWAELQVASGEAGPAFEVRYRVIDEEGKRHLDYASSEALRLAGLSAAQVDALLDWQDGDDVGRAEGAEGSFYAGRVSAHRAKNAGVELVEELRLMRHMTAGDFWARRGGGEELAGGRPGGSGGRFGDGESGLAVSWDELLTTLGDGRVNLNTAPREVLSMLPVRAEAVEQILAFRAHDRDALGPLEGHVFRLAEDLEQLNGLTGPEAQILADLGKFGSETFRIEVNSRHRASGLEHRLQAVVRRSDSSSGIVQWLVD